MKMEGRIWQLAGMFIELHMSTRKRENTSIGWQNSTAEIEKQVCRPCLQWDK